ncbi:MAG: DUF3108 domain-containing protein [Salinivirgaceae bacterium]|nr:DUF3108 domain-containing protein [Salinivirgaceae bacterium]
MLKTTLFIGFIVISYSLFGQCAMKNTVFASGEKATYNVYYNLGFVWFAAAEVVFETKSKIKNNKKAYHFISTGYTLPHYDWIYKVRDTYQAIADSATLSPIWFSRNTSEGNSKVNNSYEFDYAKKLIYSSIEDSESPKFADTLQLKDCVLDVLTAIYYCRNIDFSKLKKNDTVPLKMILDNKITSLFIRYLGKEDVELKDERRYNCVKFSILLVEGSIFSGGEDMIVWVTNDKARVPVQIKAKIMVGSIYANLEKVKGLKWPITAQIPNKTSD